MLKIIRLPDVMKNTGLARSTIYKKISMDEFPGQVSLGVKSVGWIENDVQNWIKGRIATSKVEPKTVNQ